MEFQIWWLWFGLAAVFMLGEIFTEGFFLLWFGIGAALSGVLRPVAATCPVLRRVLRHG